MKNLTRFAKLFKFTPSISLSRLNLHSRYLNGRCLSFASALLEEESVQLLWCHLPICLTLMSLKNLLSVCFKSSYTLNRIILIFVKQDLTRFLRKTQIFQLRKKFITLERLKLSITFKSFLRTIHKSSLILTFRKLCQGESLQRGKNLKKKIYMTRNKSTVDFLNLGENLLMKTSP